MFYYEYYTFICSLPFLDDYGGWQKSDVQTKINWHLSCRRQLSLSHLSKANYGYMIVLTYVTLDVYHMKYYFRVLDY